VKYNSCEYCGQPVKTGTIHRHCKKILEDKIEKAIAKNTHKIYITVKADGKPKIVRCCPICGRIRTKFKGSFCLDCLKRKAREERR